MSSYFSLVRDVSIAGADSSGVATLPSSAQHNRAVALAVAPSGTRFAVATADRVISVFDASGVKRDKFATKPALDKVRAYFVLR